MGCCCFSAGSADLLCMFATPHTPPPLVGWPPGATHPFPHTQSFANALLFGCLSHFVNRIGTYFDPPSLRHWWAEWVAHTSGDTIRAIFSDIAGIPFPTYSTIRWHSKWQVLCTLWVVWDRIPAFVGRWTVSDIVRKPFCADAQLVSDEDRRFKRRVTRVSLLRPHNTPQHHTTHHACVQAVTALQLVSLHRSHRTTMQGQPRTATQHTWPKSECHTTQHTLNTSHTHTVGVLMVVHLMAPLVQCTYFLEGDGPVSLFAGKVLQQVEGILQPLTTLPPAFQADISKHGITAGSLGLPEGCTLLECINSNFSSCIEYYRARVVTPLIRRNRQFLLAAIPLNPLHRIPLSTANARTLRTLTNLPLSDSTVNAYNDWLSSAPATATLPSDLIMAWWGTGPGTAWPQLQALVQFTAIAPCTSASAERAGSVLQQTAHRNMLAFSKIDALKPVMGRYRPVCADMRLDSMPSTSLPVKHPRQPRDDDPEADTPPEEVEEPFRDDESDNDETAPPVTL